MQLELNVAQFDSNTQNMHLKIHWMKFKFQSELNWTQHSSIGFNMANALIEILSEFNLVEFNEKKHANLRFQSM
jgi:hypothetical protein